MRHSSLNFDACSERLDVLSRQSRHTPEELAEYVKLNQTRADMKRQLGL